MTAIIQKCNQHDIAFLMIDPNDKCPACHWQHKFECLSDKHANEKRMDTMSLGGMFANSVEQWKKAFDGAREMNGDAAKYEDFEDWSINSTN